MLLSQHGIKGGVVLLGEEWTLADMVQNGMIMELERLFRTPQPFIEFALERIVKKHTLSDPLSKQTR